MNRIAETMILGGIFALVATVVIALQFDKLQQQLNTCYNSGEITSPDGKKIQCLWLNSDSWKGKK